MPSGNQNHTRRRELQQDARAWAQYTGTKYTTALRQVESPLASGLLGDRMSARRLIATLEDHELVGADREGQFLGDNGLFHDSWNFNRSSDLVELALVVEVLRMFAPGPPEVSSYSLKHTVERFLAPHYPYVTNGRLIWAAAALGLPMEHPGGPNVLVGISESQHDYVSRMGRLSSDAPRAHHYRPSGYDFLAGALERASRGEPVGEWNPPEVAPAPAPFHVWLTRQAGRNDVIGDIATDYDVGVRGSYHRIARTPDDLRLILDEEGAEHGFVESAEAAIAEWARRSSAPS